jgi:chromosome partitioning protein
MRQLSIINHKGGVGKTTTAVNLAAAFACRGRRVLLIDYDPQGNASDMLGLARELVDLEYGSAEFTLQRGPFRPQRNVQVAGLDVLPATNELSFLEQEFFGNQKILAGVGRWLRTALEPVKNDYDVVIIDCAPTFGLLAINAMVACPEVLIPVQLAPASVPGALRLKSSIEQLRTTVDASLRILGVLGTFHVERSRKHQEVFEILQERFGGLVLRQRIHHSQAVANAAETGQPVFTLKPAERGAVEYDLLAEEVEARV